MWSRPLVDLAGGCWYKAEYRPWQLLRPGTNQSISCPRLTSLRWCGHKAEYRPSQLLRPGTKRRILTSLRECRYKAEYRPSQLLCPATLQWVPLTQRILDALAVAPVPNLSLLEPPLRNDDACILPPPSAVEPADPSGAPGALGAFGAQNMWAHVARFATVSFGQHVVALGDLAQMLTPASCELVARIVKEWSEFVGPRFVEYSTLALE